MVQQHKSLKLLKGFGRSCGSGPTVRAIENFQLEKVIIPLFLTF